MKKLSLAFGVISAVVMLSSCSVATTAYTPDYNGYTVGYGGNVVTDNYVGYGSYDNYVGYGGWASSYYSPGYRANYSPGGYDGRGGHR